MRKAFGSKRYHQQDLDSEIHIVRVARNHQYQQKL